MLIFPLQLILLPEVRSYEAHFDLISIVHAHADMKYKTGAFTLNLPLLLLNTFL